MFIETGRVVHRNTNECGIGHKCLRFVGLLAFALTLAGCTTLYEGKYNFSDGWREAQVIQIEHSSEIPKPQFSDCRDSAPLQQLATDKFIVLSYKHLNRPRKRVVPFSPSSGVRVDQLVYMNVLDCNSTLTPRSKAAATFKQANVVLKDTAWQSLQLSRTRLA